jgi:hypothetical protein
MNKALKRYLRLQELTSMCHAPLLFVKNLSSHKDMMNACRRFSTLVFVSSVAARCLVSSRIRARAAKTGPNLPSHRASAYIDTLFLGKIYWKVHTQMDETMQASQAQPKNSLA